MTIATQLFIGVSVPIPELFLPVQNHQWNKPLGGLWTSTYDVQRQSSAWVDWCRAEEFGNPDNYYWSLLTPLPHARVATINDVADLDRFVRHYTDSANPMPHLITALDFERIAQDNDAIHLTDGGQWATRFSTPSLYGWDCECSLWLRWCFDAVAVLRCPSQAEREAA